MMSLSIFFFSSRRRHTRWTGDWSSDVCSSDLSGGKVSAEDLGREVELFSPVVNDGPSEETLPPLVHLARHPFGGLRENRVAVDGQLEVALVVQRRSEERRVGKECRSRGWPYH